MLYIVAQQLEKHTDLFSFCGCLDVRFLSRNTSQPQSCALVIRGLGAEPLTSILQNVIHLHCLLTYYCIELAYFDTIE